MPRLFKTIGLLGSGPRAGAEGARGRAGPHARRRPACAGGTHAIVCVQASNVNSGAFDPIGDICARAHGDGAWVHVDGAFGLWAAAAPARAESLAGADRADSWATDAHKWLNVSYDSGIAMVRDAASLRAAMSMSAAYLPTGLSREPFHYTPESSRRARGIEIWAALLSLGRRGTRGSRRTQLRDGVAHGGCLARRRVRSTQRCGAQSSAGGFRRRGQYRLIAWSRLLQDDGTCWCGPTVWKARAAMRISVSSWATGDNDIEASIERHPENRG